jgi:hypothetical protein
MCRETLSGLLPTKFETFEDPTEVINRAKFHADGSGDVGFTGVERRMFP